MDYTPGMTINVDDLPDVSAMSEFKEFVGVDTAGGTKNIPKALVTFPASQIVNTPAGGIAANSIQAAINELDTEKAPIANPTFTGNVVVPTADAGNEAVNKGQMDAADALKLDKSEVTFKNTSIADLSEREIFGNEIPTIAGFYILPTTGVLTPTVGAICTEKIPITPATITLYGAQIAGNSRGCVYYDDNQAKLKPLRPNGVECTYYRFEDNDGNATISNQSINGTFQQPATAKYMQFTMTFNTTIDFSTLKLLFTPRMVLGVLTGDASQSVNKTEYVGAAIPIIPNFFRSSTTGELTAYTGAKCSDVMAVKGKVVYINSADLGTGVVRAFVYFDENGSKIKPLRPNGVECSTYKLENNSGTAVNNGNFPVPINAKSLSFTVQYSTVVDISTLFLSFGYAKLAHKFVTNGYLPYARVTRFSYNINTENPLIVPYDDVTILDSETMGKDWGVLMLPENYDPNGSPVRLIISCHGGGGTVTETTSACETFNMNMYFVNQGYAVMDCGGMPESYAITKAIDWYRCLGSYFTVNAYERAYSHVLKNYNIYKDGVLLHGGSNGGLTALNVQAHSNIPVRALSGMSALVSMDNAWAVPSGGGNYGTFLSYQNRANMIRIYGMTPITTQEQLNAATIERDKIVGFDPINHNVIKNFSGDFCKVLNVPIKLWQPIDDPVVDYTLASEFVTRVKNAGGYAVLRLMESGGHSPENAGEGIGTFIYNGETQYIHPPMVELVNWMNRHK